ncbi:hypothetical protein CYLTODRAFT_423879 [Cylindrobasidium torrendii FP15055 ss-10]|uniref:MARVEL domain-containing protein n=1 Tax=Cylindrobasidium torrendii FP15055 ss-10 TaxID=1314674 RepID=A0A0D7B6W9_9AGAR|nr:hypothetical protein CYLTODRAFT_423879 [Cylindrobasidium torrendii FP15055 ss-10]
MKSGIDGHIRRGHPIIFGLLILFGIVELAISAWLTSRFSKYHNESSGSEESRVNYTLFCSIWTVVLGAVYLVLFFYAATGSALTSILSHIVFFSLTWIFWTAAAAAITEMLGGGLNCGTQKEFVYCGQLNALEAFAWMEWIFTTFALIFVIVRGIKAARRGDGYGGSLVV